MIVAETDREMLCPNCGSKLRPNKGRAGRFYDGYCNECDMPIEHGIEPERIYCNPEICPNCQYIGDGDSWCDVTGEIVLCDWEPTDEYMGEGCPFRREAIKVNPRKKRRKQ